MKKETQILIENFFKRNEKLNYLLKNIITTITEIVDCVKNGGKILICGNGGSAADSEHIAGELLKSFVKKRPMNDSIRQSLKSKFGEEGEFIADNLQEGVKCIPLTSFTAFNTAFLNDCNEKMLYAQLVNVLGDEKDIFIGISTSGNSKNVCYAAQMAKAKGLTVIGMTGEKGGKLKELSDVLLNAPSNETYKIQEYHLPIYHLLCLCIESEMFEI